MSDLNATYQKLLAQQKRVAILDSVQGVLEWDYRTYMPKEGAPHRAEQSALLAGLRHEWSTAPEVGAMLNELEQGEYGGNKLSVEAVNLREWRHDYDRMVKLPKELVEELTRTSTHAQDAWKKARETRQFNLFRPWLEKTITLKRREANYLGYDDEPYDALLDGFEPGARTSEVAVVLSHLRDQLVVILKAIAGSPRQPDVSCLHREFPAAAQAAFGREVAEAIGYNFDSGRLDTTTHPFCSGLGPSDVRITTRYDEHFLNGALFGVIHESGHGIYQQNLPGEHWGSPAGDPVSLGIHESQSRLWENMVGRSRAFWEHWFPKAQAAFPALRDVKLDDFHFAINAVKPSFIRVEADEVTYNLHILLRFELERAMLNGELTAADAPGAWNDKFQRYFGLKVPDDAAGCLQDIHWSSGYIGYFPTYSLGNLNAAQFFERARADLGDLDDMFRRGEFQPLRRWLTDKIHSQGRRYRAAHLIEVVTGKPLEAKALVGYLKGKFGELYQVKFEESVKV